MKRIKIGDVVQSDYGKGKVLAVTNQWFIHDNTVDGGTEEFAILKVEDTFTIIREPALQPD